MCYVPGTAAGSGDKAVSLPVDMPLTAQWQSLRPGNPEEGQDMAAGRDGGKRAWSLSPASFWFRMYQLCDLRQVTPTA